MTTRDSSGGLTRAVGEAIADIREKLVEEAWFGRALNPGNRPISDALGVTPSNRDEELPDGEKDPAILPDTLRHGGPISEALGWTREGGRSITTEPEAHARYNDQSLEWGR